MRSHYDELGVEPSASPEEIKKAYYAQSKKRHPDKDGDAEDFARLSNAYEVLSDPERRRLYDETGQDRVRSLEAEVQNELMLLFSHLLTIEKPTAPLLDIARLRLNESKSMISDNRKQLHQQRGKFQAKRDKIKSKGEANLFHMLIDQQLAAIASGLERLDHDDEVREACLKALDDYSEDWCAPEPKKRDRYEEFAIRMNDGNIFLPEFKL